MTNAPSTLTSEHISEHTSVYISEPIPATTSQLTRKQSRFVSEYLVDNNGKRAAIRAGYSEHTSQEQSSRLLSKAKIAREVAAGMAAQAERNEISADYVLAVITKVIMERCGTGEHANPQAVLKGAELLGRHFAMFTDKAVVDVNHGLQDMTDAELEAHARQLADKVGGTLPVRLITAKTG